MDQDIIDIYDMLESDTAYDKSPLSHASGVRDVMASTGGLIGLLGFSEFTPHAQQLDLYQTGQMATLGDWLGHLYEDLPTHLGLMSGYIGDMAEAGRLDGFNTPVAEATTSRSASIAGGGFVNLSGVSARAIMLGAPMAVYAAETGSGSGGSPVGATPAAGKCSSMGNAFGSIMGKSNQFMGQAMGALGQIGGLVSGIAGGGILGAVSKFANLGALGSVPGIGALGSLAGGGFAQVGQLAQMGSLISGIAATGNIGALGSLGGMLGGSMQPLAQIGGLLSSMGGLATQTGALGSGLSGYPVADLRGQLSGVNASIYQADTTQVQAALLEVASGLEDLLGVSVVPGNITNFIVQLRGLAVFLADGRLAQIGDITPLLTDLTAFVTNLRLYVDPSDALTLLIRRIETLVGVLTPLSNINALVGDVNTFNTTLYGMGGVTGYGDVGGTILQASSLIGRLGSLGGVAGMIPGFAGISGALGPMQGLVGLLGSVSSGNIGGVIGSMNGLMGNMQGILGSLPGLSGIMGSLGGIGGIGGILGGQGLVGITGMLGGLMGSGGLGGVMGGIGAMVAGERGMLGQAQGRLKKIAGAYNLKMLNGNACAKGVMDSVGSDGLKTATGGSQGGSGGSGSGSGSGTGGSGSGSGSSGSPKGTSEFSDFGQDNSSYSPLGDPKPSDFGFGGDHTTAPLFDPNISGGNKPGGFGDSLPNINTYTPAPEDTPTKGDGTNPYAGDPAVVDGVPQDIPTKGDGTNPYAGKLYE